MQVNRLIVRFLLLGSLLLLSGRPLAVAPVRAAAPLASTAGRASSQDWSDRYVIFMSGVCPDKTSTKALASALGLLWPHNWIQDNLLCKPLTPDGRVDAAGRASQDFSALIQQLKQARGFTFKPLYFSYSTEPQFPTSYTPKESQQHLGTSVQLLQNLIYGTLCKDPGASFDLVGHSLGGAVAADWVVTEGAADYRCQNGSAIEPLKSVHSLVTFDSPLQKVSAGAHSLDHLEQWLADAAILAAVSVSAPELAADATVLANFYTAQWASPVDADITDAGLAINDPSTGVLARLYDRVLSKSHVLSIGNRRDLFIDQGVTWVGKGDTQEGSANNPLIEDCTSGHPDSVCHRPVLSNPTALGWAVKMIVNGQLPSDPASGWWNGAEATSLIQPDYTATVSFSAHAYTTHRFATIDHVNFTAQWQIGSNRSWWVVCTDSHQSQDGNYGCPGTVKAPSDLTGAAAPLKVSFDAYPQVSETAPHTNSPGGPHMLYIPLKSPAPAPTPIPPTSTPVPPTATPVPPTNTPAPAPLVMTISVNPTTVMVGQTNQLCINVSEEASVALTYTYNGGQSTSIPLQTPNFAAGATCFTTQPLTVPGTVVITAVGTPTGGGGSVSSQATVTVGSPAPIIPGGLWVSPANGSTTTGPVQFEAEAYHTNPGDPAIAYVNFTMRWPTIYPAWVIACTANSPIGQAPDGHALYGCTVDLSTVTPGPPPGPVSISFDVYDSQYVRGQPGHYNPAPNGEHIISFAPLMNHTVSVKVPATSQWVDTGLQVTAGDHLQITASGQWSPGAPNAAMVGPDGSDQPWPDNFLNLTDIGQCASCASTSTAHWAALIGYIGANPPQAGSYTSTSVAGDAQHVFLVGSNLTSTTQITGELWLNFNDDAYSDSTSDNFGQVNAQVTVDPAN